MVNRVGERRVVLALLFLLGSFVLGAALMCCGGEGERGGVDKGVNEGEGKEDVLTDKSFPLPKAIDPKIGNGIPSSIAVGDIDGDGYLDATFIFVSSVKPKLWLVVVFGDATGGYAKQLVQELETTTVQLSSSRDSGSEVVVIGDWDGNGLLDVLTARGALLNQGARELRWQPIPGFTYAGNRLAPVALASIRGDGKAHLLRGTANGVDDCVSGAPCTRLPGPDRNIEDLVVGDFDHDGKPDIIAGGQILPTSSLYWRSDAAWASAAEVTGLSGVDVEAGDFDGDGYPDLVAQDMTRISDFPGQTMIWLSDPRAAGGFTLRQTFVN
jgi:hypothetical protein